MKSPQAYLFVIAASLMALTAGFLLWLKAHQQLGEPGLSLDLPLQVLDYHSVPVEISAMEINTLPKDTQFARRNYIRVHDGKTNQIQLGIVLMGADRTSLHKPQLCLVGQGWTIQKSEPVEIPIHRPHAYGLPVMKLTSTRTVRLDNGQMLPVTGLYVYWFVAHQRLTANHWQRMWWMAKNLITTGVLQRWAYVSCFAVCLPGGEKALFEEMSRFAAAAVPEFQKATGPALATAKLSSQAGRAGLQAAGVQSQGQLTHDEGPIRNASWQPAFRAARK